jgi:hypothetical protein
MTDPVMAMPSMEQLGVQVDYDFDTPFNILNQGPGHVDPAGNGSLAEVSGDIPRGFEGHGFIQFQGTLTSISWAIPFPEFWQGFQMGLPSTSIPEPATLALFGIAVAGLGFPRRRRLH